jgi:hypothetical protein
VLFAECVREWGLLSRRCDASPFVLEFELCVLFAECVRER